MNKYGLDVDYFRKKLEGILRDIKRYAPDEMYRELTKLANVAKAEWDEEDTHD